jgi:hypothetical protein
MSEIALLVKQYDEELREALKWGRSGLFKDSDEKNFVKSQVQLGQKHADEVICIFADEADLDFFYKLYLES